MKTFFLRISHDKVSNKALENCKVMKYLEKDLEYDFESEKRKFLVELFFTMAIKSTPAIFAFIII